MKWLVVGHEEVMNSAFFFCFELRWGFGGNLSSAFSKSKNRD